MGSVKILLIWGNLEEWKQTYQIVNKDEEKKCHETGLKYTDYSLASKSQAAKQQKGK